MSIKGKVLTTIGSAGTALSLVTAMMPTAFAMVPSGGSEGGSTKDGTLNLDGNVNGSTNSNSELIKNAGEAANGIYSDVLKLSTPIAAAAIGGAIIFSWFSHDEKKIGMAKSIVKYVGATWIVLHILGWIFNYANGFLSGSSRH